MRASLVALIAFTSLGCGDEIGVLCTRYLECGQYESRAECTAYFDLVFEQLDERCTNVSDVTARYRELLDCVGQRECSELDEGSPVCDPQRDAYIAAVNAGGGARCRPDMD